MSGTDQALLDAARRVLRAADPQTRRAGDEPAVWRAIDDAGLPRAWLPEAHGGAGASLADGFAILQLAGEVALDVPLAETLLAGWLLAAAGLPVPDGALASAGADPDADGEAAGVVIRDGRLTGRLRGAAFARAADHLAVVCTDRGAGDGADRGAGDAADRGAGADADRGRRRSAAIVVALVERAACAIEPHDNLAGDPRDAVVLDGARPVAFVALDDGDLHARWWAMGAVARSCQMAGALQGILVRSIGHAGERIAFERPLAKFQAIQHALARLAGETAAAVAVSSSAADALSSCGDASGADRDDGVFLEVASAKIRVGEAAAAGAAVAHQIHGAIGFSTEHALHRFTRRLWAWRDDFGSESAWAAALGARAVRWGEGLWPVLAAR